MTVFSCLERHAVQTASAETPARGSLLRTASMVLTRILVLIAALSTGFGLLGALTAKFAGGMCETMLMSFASTAILLLLHLFKKNAPSLKATLIWLMLNAYVLFVAYGMALHEIDSL
jgi:hypothetical protein